MSQRSDAALTRCVSALRSDVGPDGVSAESEEGTVGTFDGQRRFQTLSRDNGEKLPAADAQTDNLTARRRAECDYGLSLPLTGAGSRSRTSKMRKGGSERRGSAEVFPVIAADL